MLYPAAVVQKCCEAGRKDAGTMELPWDQAKACREPRAGEEAEQALP